MKLSLTMLVLGIFLGAAAILGLSFRYYGYLEIHYPVYTKPFDDYRWMWCRQVFLAEYVDEDGYVTPYRACHS